MSSFWTSTESITTPSNSYIYLYGDMDMEEKLRWLDEKYLSHFENEPVDSEIHLQKPFTEMREVVQNYSITSEESEEDNTYLSYNKVVGTSLDEKLYLAFEILDYALLSAPGAPLKKALIDAGTERMYPVLLTVEFISRYSPLLQRMPTWSRKRHLSVRLRIH